MRWFWCLWIASCNFFNVYVWEISNSATHYSCICHLIFVFSAKLNITPDDPRWIGAWWGGFLLCGVLLFFSALFMFGFPQSLPGKEVEGGLESEQTMLPSSLPQDYEKSKPSNGVYQPNSNNLSCCQHLRGLRASNWLQSLYTVTQPLNASLSLNLWLPNPPCDVQSVYSYWD